MIAKTTLIVIAIIAVAARVYTGTLELAVQTL
jgi:hypothetical protein